MAFTIRNCKLPHLSTTNRGTGELAFFMRHAFDMAGWTTNDDLGGAGAWADPLNLVIDEAAGANAFSVNAATPRQVTHQRAVGGFTQAMADGGMIMMLMGSTNDQNYSMWRIVEYIDAHNVRVDSMGFSALGWVTETNIAGRVLDYNDGTLVLNSAWVEADPPTGNNRVHLKVNSTLYLECYAQPRAGLADFTQTPGSALCFMYDDDDLDQTFNAYFDGNNALFFKFDKLDITCQWALFGELEDVPSEDTFPGFVMARNQASAIGYRMQQIYVYMLGAVGFPAIRCYPDCLTGPNSTSNNLTTDQDFYESRRLINGYPGYARLRDVWVTLENTAGEGAFTRGRVPVIKAASYYLPQYAPIDGPGDWFHLTSGIVVPRQGPLDQKIVRV